MLMRPLLILLLLSLTSSIMAQDNTTENFVLVIHGGAGTILKKNMTPEKEAAYQAKLQEALQAGYKVLGSGGTSLKAVEAAIVVMEDSPLFNAGKGAVYTNNETNEMDASMMDGGTLNAGAVAGAMRIKNPVKGARMVLEQSEHVLLTGEGADEFAKKQGLEIVDPSYFGTQNRLQQLKRLQNKEKTSLDHDEDQGYALPDSSEIEFNVNIDLDKKFGTVGAVALDKHGNLAAATSTGGMTNKRFNRVGDSPIIGAGTYANNSTCAVSSTGHGEYFMRYLVAYDISALMEYKKLSLQEAADEVIHKKLKAVEGKGGVIAVDKEGNVAMPFNTRGMYRGYIKADGTTEIGIYDEE